jgi:transcriptional regulator of met regulon
MFWNEHPPPTMAKFNESFPQKVEESRFTSMGILGRHLVGCKFPSDGKKESDYNAFGFRRFWNGCKPKEITFNPHPASRTFAFHGGFQKGLIQVPQEKMKNIRKELGKILTHSEITCRKMAAILGATRSFLMAMPFLRAFTDQVVQFVTQQESIGWDKKVQIPSALQAQVREMSFIMDTWKGRTFQGKTPVRELHSDSSQTAWAGVDVTSGKMVQEFWRDRSGLHINVKELEAAINTVKSLANPKEHVSLKVDNSVTFYYLTKNGGRIPSLNQMVRPFLRWCMEN